MKIGGKLNPMRLLSQGTLTSLVKTGIGVYGYKMISTQVDKKWIRWTCYGAAALLGFHAPLAIAGLNEIWPEWNNLDRAATAKGAGVGDLAAQAAAKAASNTTV